MREDWRSFRDYGADTFYLSNDDGGGQWGSSVTPTEDTIYLAPLIAPVRARLAEFGVSRPTGILEQQCRYGVYQATAPGTQYPRSLLFEESVSYVASSSFHTVSPNLILAEGVLYWLAFGRQENLGTFTLRGVGIAAPTVGLGVSRAQIVAGSFSLRGYTLAGVTGGLPNPFTAGATEVAVNTIHPAFFARFASV